DNRIAPRGEGKPVRSRRGPATVSGRLAPQPLVSDGEGGAKSSQSRNRQPGNLPRGPPAPLLRRREDEPPAPRRAREKSLGPGMTERAAILIVGHGSREAEANAEFEALVAAYRAARPDLDVAHGYVELAQPSLEAALESLAARASLDGSANGDGAVSGDAASDGGVSGDRAGARRVVAVPLFLFAAGHVKNDLPLALDHARRRFPRVAFTAARALGVDPRLQSLLAARIAEHGAPSAGTAVIVVGRGASDPD